MSARAIFGLQVLLSLVGYSRIAPFYVAPRLAALPLPAALTPLLLLHAFRHLGMVFLVPAVVGTALPPAFAVPAAYGDLLAALLALLNDVQLGAAYYIPTFAVPALFVTHAMIFTMLIRRTR